MNDMKYSVVLKSSIEDIASLNPSFDNGVMKIAYSGANRNRMFIDKEAFDAARESIFNCPVVCNYDVAEDSIGSHDMGVVRTANGVALINKTEPVGVVPESADVWWQTEADQNGVEHDYFCANVLIWTRQAAYEHIKKNGFTDQSMEIRVTDMSKEDDGLIHVHGFQFTAFCLLESAEPCFEGAGLELFSVSDFKQQFSEMMDDFKKEFCATPVSTDGENKPTITEGGNTNVNVNEILAKYSLTAEDIDFQVDGLTEAEIDEKAAAFAQKRAEQEAKKNFAVTSQIGNELSRCISANRWYDSNWREERPAFYMIDFDLDEHVVYCDDVRNRYMVGIPFEVNGDAVTVHFDQVKRKKIVYADFEDGAATPTIDGIAAFSDDVSEKIAKLYEQIDELSTFKKNAEDKERQAGLDALFEKFAYLGENAELIALRNNCGDLDLKTIEEKCYAIVGRENEAAAMAKFSAKQPRMRVPVNPVVPDMTDDNTTPYGGVVERYAANK